MHDVVMVGPFPEDITLIKGGVQASVYGLSTALAERPDVASVTVVALATKHGRMAGERVLGDLRIVHLTAPYRYLASSVIHLPAVMKRLRGLPAPVFHIHGTGLFQAAMAVWLRAAGKRLVWTLHGLTRKETLDLFHQRKTASNFVRYLFFAGLERALERLASEIVVDTPYVTGELNRRTHVHVIPQGIFPREFDGVRDRVRDPGLILSVGVFGPRKGHQLLIEAFAKVHQAHPGAKLAIAGSIRFQSYFDGLVSRIDALGLAGAVRLLRDAERQEVVDLFGRAGIFALHSQEESQGIALCEAMSAGLPVVATNVGGIPDVVEDGISGLLTDYGDVDAFAAALLALLADETRRQAMATAARARSRQYDWQTIAQRIGTIYADISQPSGGSGRERAPLAPERG